MVTGSGMMTIRNCRAFNNGQESKVGFGFVVQNNQKFGTDRIIIEKCRAKNNYRGSIRLNDVKDIRLIRNNLSPRRRGVCYDFTKVRKTTLKGNKCSASKSRRFKQSKANFKES